MMDKTARGIEGRWRNQLGSLLDIEVDDNGGLTGSFRSAVGDGNSTNPVRGSFQQDSASNPAAIGLVVSWPTEHSVAVWSGRYSPKDDEIAASWLLTSSCGPDEWRSTLVGHDVFHRAEDDQRKIS